MIPKRNIFFRVSISIAILFFTIYFPLFSQSVQDSAQTNPVFNNAVSDTLQLKEPHRQKANRFRWNDAKFRNDTLNGKRVHRHSPLYAALFSAAVPGLGQAYNKKYWKIPIVYAGFGGLGYALYYTATNFYGYRNAYRLQVADNPNPNASFNGVSSTETLKAYRDYFKKNMDITAICTGVWYALNIIDAAVDAHLFEWNMKDDLNVSWQPSFFQGQPQYPQAAAGVKLTLSF